LDATRFACLERGVVLTSGDSGWVWLWVMGTVLLRGGCSVCPAAADLVQRLLCQFNGEVNGIGGGDRAVDLITVACLDVAKFDAAFGDITDVIGRSQVRWAFFALT
jgi:hypothetical protein